MSVVVPRRLLSTSRKLGDLSQDGIEVMEFNTLEATPRNASRSR
jgi:hypothetical protein